MTDSMWALVFDRSKDSWSKTTGLRRQQVARPRLDPAKDYRDNSWVIIKPRYAGFCGSDRGIWFRKSFGDSIAKTLDDEKKDVRVIGHELLGEIVEAGPEAERDYGYKLGDIVTTESHILCNTCYQCRIGDTHVCAADRIIGIGMDGCFAEYVKLPAQALWPTDTAKIRPEVAALQEVGIDRREVYVTNAVKHFKWEAQGKRRIHAKPTQRQISACRPWLEAEIARVRPQVLVCLGATAAQALLGREFRVSRQRGESIESPLAPHVLATVHPSSILRAPDGETRRRETERFKGEMERVAKLLRGP